MIRTSSILRACEKVINVIDSEGLTFRNTREAIGVHIDINMSNMDLESELTKIKDYYGDKFDKRLEQEINHYRQLRYSLLHKLEEIEFFFKEDAENRKTVIASNDCISCIQYIRRDDYGSLYVHMRSSDVEGLLPLDLFYLCDILDELNKTKADLKIKYSEVNVVIGSAHYYTNNSPRE